MADEADRAEVHTENLVKLGIAMAKSTRTLIASGYCHNCGEEFKDKPKGWLFCDADCRDDYDAIREARKRNG